VTKFIDLRPGDRLTDFFAWGCVPQHAVRVIRACDDGLFVKCREGRHFLDGQTEDDGNLVGCEIATT
jgi:hypothetical protein